MERRACGLRGLGYGGLSCGGIGPSLSIERWIVRWLGFQLSIHYYARPRGPWLAFASSCLGMVLYG